MAENILDELAATFDKSSSREPELEKTSRDLAKSTEFSAEALSESQKDTPENQGFQAELDQEGENKFKFGRPESSSNSDSLKSGGLGIDTEAESAGFNGTNPDTLHVNKDQKGDRLLAELKNARAALNELLAWKEDLRLLAMRQNTLEAYCDSWTKEANLFFRRVVIINKRLESHRKNKRA